MHSWYAVHTKPRQEHLAVTHLQRQGFESYLPLCRERRLRQGAYAWQVAPLFPRYLFVHLDLTEDNVAPIRSTIGCCGLVRFGTRIPSLPIGMIEALRMRSSAEGVVNLDQPDWQPGQHLRVSEGPFMGLDGIFQARSGTERVIVLLEWLGAPRAVELPEQFLVASG